jgi:hypothetical protein
MRQQTGSGSMSKIMIKIKRANRVPTLNLNHNLAPREMEDC